jgi:large subunit ribosomal protein L9
MTKKTRKEVQLILKKTLPFLGKSGSLVIVKSGYARNYLIPNQLGEIANLQSLKNLEIQQEKQEKEEKRKVDHCHQKKQVLEQHGVFILRKRTSQGDKIFGKIASKQILELLETTVKLDLKEAKVSLPEIKELGRYQFNLSLHPKVKVNLSLEILEQ